MLEAPSEVERAHVNLRSELPDTHGFGQFVLDIGKDFLELVGCQATAKPCGRVFCVQGSLRVDVELFRPPLVGLHYRVLPAFTD